MNRRHLAFVVTACLPGVLMVAPPVAAVAASPGTLSGVVDFGGTGASAATVRLVAWPSGRSLASLKSGARVHVAQVGSVRTDAAGAFSLNPSVGRLGAKYRDAAGGVNVELLVSDVRGHVGYEASWSSAVAVPGTSAANSPLVASTGNPEVVHVDLKTAHIRVSLRRDGTQADRKIVVEKDQVPNPAVSTDVADPLPPRYECTITSGSKIKNRPEQFLDLYSTAKVHARVTESIKSEQTLGIALKFEAGPWTIEGSGSATKEGGARASVPYDKDRLLYNAVDYRRFTKRCGFYVDSLNTEHQLRPTGVDELLLDHTTPIYPLPASYSICMPVHPRKIGTVTYWKTEGANHKFTTGIDLGVVKVSSQGVFSKATEVGWTPHAKGALCGAGDGWAKARVAGARDRYTPAPPTHCKRPGPCPEGNKHS